MENMEQVFQEQGETVYKYLLSLCREEDLARELTQETFYQAVRSIGRFDGSCKLSVWLCQIGKHLWYRHLKKTGRQPEPEVAGAVPSAEEEVLAREGRRLLLQQIHSLPEPGREVVYLRALGGLSFREIGAVLGETENWARVTFYRCKLRLKGGMEHE